MQNTLNPKYKLLMQRNLIKPEGDTFFCWLLPNRVKLTRLALKLHVIH